MPVGQLTVELQASVAKFQSDLQQASAHATKTAREIDNAFGELKGKLLEVGAALGIAFSAGAFVETIKGAIEAEAALKDLGARAGLTGEQFSSFVRAARQSGTDLESVANMSARLSKALIESNDANSKSAAVLRALGIASGDTAKLLANPVLAVTTLAKALETLPEGGTKAAAQMIVLGRAGGSTSAFLKELADQQTVQASRTQAQIDAAKALTDQFTDLQLHSDNVKTALANALIPTLSDVAKAFDNVVTGAGGAQSTIAGLAAQGQIREWAQDAAIALGTVGEALLFVVRSGAALKGSVDVIAEDLKVLAAAANAPSKKPFGSLGFSPEEANAANKALEDAVAHRNAVLAAANKRYSDLWNESGTTFTDALRKQFSQSNALAAANANPDGNLDARDLQVQAARNAAADKAAKDAAAKAKAVQDAINAATQHASGDDPAKKILEGQLKELQSSIAQEEALLNTRKEFLQQYFDQGYLSIKDYYDKRRDVESQAYAFETAQRNKEIADLNAYANRPDQTEVNRQDARNKIIDVQKQQAQADQNLAKQGVLLWFQEQAAAKQYQRTLVDISAQLLELQGNTAKATKLRFDAQNEDQRRQLAANGDTAALAQLDNIERLSVAQAGLNDQQKAYGTVLQDLANIQGHIDLEAQTGAITELDALKQKGDAARAYAAALKPVAEAYKQIAIASGDPAAIVNAQKLELELETLGAQADAVAKKFSDVFVGSFTNALDELVSGTKSFKDVLKDLGKELDQQLTHIASQQISEQLFGKNGPLGGVGDFFAKMFTGGSGDATGAGGAAAATAGLTGLGSSAGVTSTAMTVLATAAQTAASALASISASSIGGGGGGAGFGDLFDFGSSQGAGYGDFYDFGGGFANGGSPPIGKVSMVGERGPELFVPKQAGDIIPAEVLKAKRGGRAQQHVYNISVNVPGNVSSATASQIASQTAREIRRTQARSLAS